MKRELSFFLVVLERSAISGPTLFTGCDSLDVAMISISAFSVLTTGLAKKHTYKKDVI